MYKYDKRHYSLIHINIKFSERNFRIMLGNSNSKTSRYNIYMYLLKLTLFIFKTQIKN